MPAPALKRHFTDAEVDRLVRFYEAAEREIMDKLTRALLKGNVTWYLTAQRRQVEAILQQLRDGSRQWCTEAIPHFYLQGAEAADSMIKQAGLATGLGFGAMHQEAAQVLAENTFERLTGVSDVIGRQVSDIYRDLALESVRGTVVGYDTWRQVAQRYRDKLAAQGVTGFRDRAGREWNMGSYTRMVARTTTMEAHTQGTVNRLAEQGHDLVIVSYHLGACELCQPWEGQVLSLTGQTAGYPTLDEAKAAGLFHPNCRHAISLYIDLDAEDDEPAAQEPPPQKTLQELVQEASAGLPTDPTQLSISDIRTVGRVVMEAAQEPYKASATELERLWKAYDATGHKELYTQWRDLNGQVNAVYRKLMTIEETGYTTLEQLQQAADKLIPELTKRRTAADTIMLQIDALRAQLRNRTQNAETLKSVLEQVRSVGSKGLDINKHLNKSRSAMKQTIEQAYSYYPADWVQRSVQQGTMKPKKTGRGYYQHGYGISDSVIALNGSKNSGAALRCAMHELGHRMEHCVPGIYETEQDFYAKRTKDEPLEWLGPGYARYEMTRKDDFISPYMGKEYAKQAHAYELVSMGFEYAYTDPATLWKDVEFAEWIYGILALF